MKTADAIFKWPVAMMKTTSSFSSGSAGMKTPDVVSKWLVAIMKTAMRRFQCPVSGINRLMPISGGEGPA
jgi:hypothetical protein